MPSSAKIQRNKDYPINRKLSASWFKLFKMNTIKLSKSFILYFIGIINDISSKIQTNTLKENEMKINVWESIKIIFWFKFFSLNHFIYEKFYRIEK